MRLTTAILASVLAACSCTAHMHPAGRSPVQQHNALVRITMTCGDSRFVGSGVLIKPDTVLTAAHVVHCPVLPGSNLPIYLPADKVTVNGDQQEISAEVVDSRLLPDLAVVRVRGLERYYTPVVIGPAPSIGDRVCEVSAEPRVTYRCGTVQEGRSGQIYVDFLVQHGNSGSAMYDAHGRLVGIVTNLISCDGCGGFGSALDAWRSDLKLE